MISFFDWDPHNIEHISWHHVIPAEVEEIFEGRYYFYKAWTGRYIALGRTASGRPLTCIFERTSRPGEIRIITARDMSERERRLYRKKGGHP